MLLTFWNQEFAKHAKHAVRPVLNKLEIFLQYDLVKNVFGQSQTGFDFDEVINNRKILLVRLSAGQMDEKTINIFGTFIMSKLVSAAFRRESIPEDERVPFHLYIDEFQNFVSLAVSFDRVLSEMRKYRLIMSGLANQFVEQLPRQVRAAVFGNVKTMVVFRVSPIDAKLLSHQFADFTPEEITALDTGEAIGRVGGSQDSFNLKCDPPGAKPERSNAAWIKQRCRRKFASRLKELTKPELIRQLYLAGCCRTLEGKELVNAKVVVAVERAAAVKGNVRRFRKWVYRKWRELEREGKDLTEETVPDLWRAFEQVAEWVEGAQAKKQAAQEKEARQRAYRERKRAKELEERKAKAQAVVTPDSEVVAGKIMPAEAVAKNVKQAAGAETMPVVKNDKPQRKKQARKPKVAVPETAAPEPVPPRVVRVDEEGGAKNPDDDFQ